MILPVFLFNFWSSLQKTLQILKLFWVFFSRNFRC